MSHDARAQKHANITCSNRAAPSPLAAGGRVSSHTRKLKHKPDEEMYQNYANIYFGMAEEENVCVTESIEMKSKEKEKMQKKEHNV